MASWHQQKSSTGRISRRINGLWAPTDQPTEAHLATYYRIINTPSDPGRGWALRATIGLALDPSLTDDFRVTAARIVADNLSTWQLPEGLAAHKSVLGMLRQLAAEHESPDNDENGYVEPIGSLIAEAHARAHQAHARAQSRASDSARTAARRDRHM